MVRWALRISRTFFESGLGIFFVLLKVAGPCRSTTTNKFVTFFHAADKPAGAAGTDGVVYDLACITTQHPAGDGDVIFFVAQHRCWVRVERKMQAETGDDLRLTFGFCGVAPTFSSNGSGSGSGNVSSPIEGVTCCHI